MKLMQEIRSVVLRDAYGIHPQVLAVVTRIASSIV
jgi:hypothetical protein